MAQEKESLRIWQNWSRPILDDLFNAAASAGMQLMPDIAVEEMEEILKSAFEATSAKQMDKAKNSISSIRRLDYFALRRDSHRYAVDLFYRTYYPRRGAPPLLDEYLESLLKLEAQGLNKMQMAKKLGAKTNEEIKKDADRIRKELATAKNRYKEMVNKIRKLGALQWKTIEQELKRKS